MQETSETFALGGASEEEIARYRSVSRLAVVTLILGLASVLALAHPLMWLVPILAVICAVAADATIARSEGALTGRLAVQLGLALALIFAGWSATQFFVGRAIVVRQAKKVSDRWIGLLQEGSLQYAHQWTLPNVMREPPGVPLDNYYKKGSEGDEEFIKYFESGIQRRLSRLSDADSVRFVERESLTTTRLDRFVTLRYALESTEDPTEFYVIVHRFTDPDSLMTSWQIHDVVDAAEVPADA